MTPLTVGSTFTGVGGADLGFEQAGFEISWQCELDAWKRSVLAAHWPDVQIFDDITTMLDPPPVDILIGGFPCQDLSVAGQRKGFTGERSVLAFEFLRLAESIRPRWLILENVPGLLSSSQGADFARLIDEVVACGYGVAWRILDARFFGVPQRRRRVFIVARRTDALVDSPEASRLALRALRESGSGDIAEGWQAWQETAGGAGEGAEGGRVVGVNGDVTESISNAVTRKWAKGTGGPAGDECQNLITDSLAFRKSRRAQSMNDDETWVEGDHANTLNSFDAGDVRTTHAIIAQTSAFKAGQGASAGGIGYEDEVAPTLTAAPSGSNQVPTILTPTVIAFGHKQGIDIQPSEKHTPTLRVGGAGAAIVSDSYYVEDCENAALRANGANDGPPRTDKHPLVVQEHLIPFDTNFSNQQAPGGNTAATLDTRGRQGVADQMSVRRLTPTECERLMGWPDEWTAPEGVKAPDSKRYAACGDGIVAPVAFWIADRIRMIEGEA